MNGVQRFVKYKRVFKMLQPLIVQHFKNPFKLLMQLGLITADAVQLPAGLPEVVHRW